MSAYANDPRVHANAASNQFYDVNLGDGRTGLVWVQGNGEWVASRDAVTAQVLATADEAIRSLIGDPQ